MTEQNEEEQRQPQADESRVNEVVIVKKRTLVNCEEFVSIQLKSSDGTIGSLLKKAMSATQLNNLKDNDDKLGIQEFFLKNILFYYILLHRITNNMYRIQRRLTRTIYQT